MRIAKGDRAFTIRPKGVHRRGGLSARLSGLATVDLGEGARYLRWNVAALEQRLNSRAASGPPYRPSSASTRRRRWRGPETTSARKRISQESF